VSVSHTITRTYKDQSANAMQQVETITDAFERNFDQAVPIAANTQYNIAWTKSKLKALGISSDQAVTIYTNSPSGGTPQDTIAIAAGQNLVWTSATDGSAKCPFSNDVTTIYITNAAGSPANVKIRSVSSN